MQESAEAVLAEYATKPLAGVVEWIAEPSPDGRAITPTLRLLLDGLRRHGLAVAAVSFAAEPLLRLHRRDPARRAGLLTLVGALAHVRRSRNIPFDGIL